jgi:hypothetical protein
MFAWTLRDASRSHKLIGKPRIIGNIEKRGVKLAKL